MTSASGGFGWIHGALAAALACAGSGLGQVPADAALDHATALIRQDRLSEARSALQALITGAPEPPAEAFYQLAVCDAREGLTEVADRRLDAALARDPDLLPALHLKAYLQFSSGDYPAALEWADRFLQVRPNGGETRKVAGLARFMLGDRPGAERDLKHATDLLPGDFDAHYYLGRVYFEGSRLTLALASFRRAIELNPASVKAHNHLGQALEGLTRFVEAKDAYRHSIRVERQGIVRSEWPYYNLGALLLSDGDSGQAVGLLEQALRRNPSSVQTQVKLGVAYSAAGRLEDAVQQLSHAVAADPDSADGHYQLGRVLMKLGRGAEARVHLALFEQLREE